MDAAKIKKGLNLKAFKQRKINYNKPVEIYRNLNNKEYRYSIRQNKLVVAHSNELKLRDCSFVVSETGRQRAVREQRKNVHAFVSGFLIKKNTPILGETQQEVFYDPFQFENFINFETLKPIHAAKRVYFSVFGCFASIK